MTLTEAASLTKKSVYYVGIPLGAIIVIWIIIQMITPQATLPEKYITPDYLCGPLPKLELESIEQPTSNTQFNIETTTGAIPDLPKVVNVFKYNHPGQSLLALEESKIIAERLGFAPEIYTRKSVVEYEWQNYDNGQTLIIETGNLNLNLTTDFTAPGSETYSHLLPSEENAKSIAQSYLRSANLLTDDYQDGDQRTYLVQITSSGELREAPSLSEADLIRVDFFRKEALIIIDPELVDTAEIGSTLQEKLEEEEEVTIRDEDQKSVKVKKYNTDVKNDSPIFGNISVLVGGREEEESRDFKIFGLTYQNWIISDSPCGTYGLISPEEAVRKVQEGEGTLVYLMEKNGDRIIPYASKSVSGMTILEVDIAYLDTSAKQTYLQPVYYIRGEAEFENGEFGEFYYYVPAIDYDAIPDDAGQQSPDEESSSE
ncbi:hypothetical protein JW710_02780 [Candidatus Dojkabacteria bacterium]|nr:hypothetical protein [Candidatus Dojkabacteria bacterium]